jgi:hypothetical protein
MQGFLSRFASGFAGARKGRPERCNGTIHDFALLNALLHVPSTHVALRQAAADFAYHPRCRRNGQGSTEQIDSSRPPPTLAKSPSFLSALSSAPAMATAALGRATIVLHV